MAAVVAGNEAAVAYFFHDHFEPLLRHNALKAMGATHRGRALMWDDLVQEFFIYLNADDWQRLRRYDERLPLAAWLSVVSYRFFKDFFRSLSEKAVHVPICNIEEGEAAVSEVQASELEEDVRRVLAYVQPERSRRVLEALLINEATPDEVAQQQGISIDNVYTIKRRALQQLRQHYWADLNKEYH